MLRSIEEKNWMEPKEKTSRCHVSHDITDSRIETDHGRVLLSLSSLSRARE